MNPSPVQHGVASLTHGAAAPLRAAGHRLDSVHWNALAQQSFPLIRAVVRGSQDGTVLAPEHSDPPVAWVIHAFGFMQQIGDMAPGAHDAAFARMLMGAGPDLPRYLLWYAPAEHWRRWLRQNLAAVHERTRIRWEIDAHCLTKRGTSFAPPGWRVERLSRHWIQKSQPLGLSIGTRFWRSLDDFFQYGVGVCMVDDQERVGAAAYSACVADGLSETDIAVAEGLRGQGLGYAAASALMAECMRRSLTPTWDCFEANTGSVRLAQKLGFTPVQIYPLCSFELPAAGAASRQAPK